MSEEMTPYELGPAFPMSMRLDHAGITIQTDDWRTFKVWIERELQYWGNFYENQPVPFRNAVSPQLRELKHLQEAANEYGRAKEANEPGADDRLIKAVQTFRQGRFIPKDGPNSDLIWKLASEESNGLACALLAAIRGDTLKIAAEGLGPSFDLTQFVNLTTMARMLTGHYQRLHEARLAVTSQTLDDLKAEIQQAISTMDHDVGHKLTNADTYLQAAKEGLAQITDQTTKAEARLQSLEQKYRIGKEYGEAVKYWQHKRWWHTGTKYGAMAVLASLLYVPIQIFLNQLPNLQKFLDGLATTNDRTLVPLAVILSFMAFCYVSAVRFMTRFYSEHHADGEDAHLRETLIKTYLAMRKDDEHKLNEGERLLALHALFRGSARAPTADDTPPVNTLEALVTALKPTTK
jgi:hypothetical protein